MKEKFIIPCVVMKYASKHSIPCDLRKHKNKMNLSTKTLAKTFKFLQAGTISEGLCDSSVQQFIEKHGDVGVVRPVSLAGKKVIRSLHHLLKKSKLLRKIPQHMEIHMKLYLTLSLHNSIMIQYFVHTPEIFMYNFTKHHSILMKEKL